MKWSGTSLRASLGALLLVLSSVCSLLISPLANAASSLDDAYPHTNTLKLGMDQDYHPTVNCDTVQSVETSYVTKIFTDSSVFWNSTGGSGSGDTREAEYASFNNALDHGAWSVAQYQDGTSGSADYRVILVWSETGGALNWVDGGGGTHYVYAHKTGDIHQVELTSRAWYIGSGDPCSFIANHNSGQTDGVVSGNSPTSMTNFLAANWSPINYPVDYEGPPVVEGAADEVRPAISYTVANKTITLKDDSSPTAGVKPYQLKYVMSLGTFESGVLFYEGYIGAGDKVTFTVDKLDSAAVQFFYANLDGTLKTDTDEFDYHETDVTFDVDGSTFSSSVDGSTCDDSDHCTAQLLFTTIYFINLYHCVICFNSTSFNFIKI